MKKKSFFIQTIFVLAVFFQAHFVLRSQTNSGYVYLSGKQFKINGVNFYPMVINYSVKLISNGSGGFYLSPQPSSCITWDSNIQDFTCGTPTSCMNKLQSDMTKMVSMGFNTIRVGIGVKNQNGVLASDYGVQLSPPYTQHFAYIDQLLSIISASGLKVIFGTGGGSKIDLISNDYKNYLSALSSHLKNNTTVFAYDLFNEPIGADVTQDKNIICGMVRDWYYSIKYNAPYQHVTIGLSGIEDVLGWDPGIMTLDFISFHPYPISRTNWTNVERDLKWFSKVVKTPWIIGETGFGGTDQIITPPCTNVGSEYDQKQYALFTLQRSQDCSSSGYSWWVYQEFKYDDCPNLGAIQNYYGLKQRSPNDLNKQAATAFQNFVLNPINSNCISPSNYYNSNNYTTFEVSGTIHDQNGNPIKDAVISGWKIVTSGGSFFTTLSDDNGNFTLYTDNVGHPIVQIAISCYGGSKYSTGWFPNGIPSNNINVSLNTHIPSSDITVNNVTISNNQTQDYNASNSINFNTFTNDGNGVIGGQTRAKSNNIIKLNTGFKAKAGSYFRAYNGPVFMNCSNSSFKNENSDHPSYYPPLKKDYQIDTTIILSPKNEKEETIFSVYPNPSSGKFTIVANQSKSDNSSSIEITISDIIGNIVSHVSANNNHSETVDFTNQPQGIYFIKAVSSSGELLGIEKVVVQY